MNDDSLKVRPQVLVSDDSKLQVQDAILCNRVLGHLLLCAGSLNAGAWKLSGLNFRNLQLCLLPFSVILFSVHLTLNKKCNTNM